MANSIAKAYVQIVPSAKGIKGSISKAIGNESVSAGKMAGGSIVGSIKHLIATAGLGAALVSAINIGGELEQNLGGTEAVFGDFAKDIQKVASDAYKNMGMSASEYMETANKMTSLFKGSGMETGEAMDLTTMAMQRAADVASVMGISTESAMESIAGAAKGNFTMMDNLGVAMNATTLEAYALEKGINFKWNTASNAEKSTLAMEMFMDRTQDMAGNFAREADETISGSLGAMKSAFKDLVGNMVTGGDIEKPLTALLQTSVTFLTKNLAPAVMKLLTALPGVIQTAITTLGPQIMTAGLSLLDKLSEGLVTGLPMITGNLATMVQGLAQGIQTYAPMIIDGAMTLIMSLAQGLIESLPILIESLPTIVSTIVSSLLTFFTEQAPRLLFSALEMIQTLATGLINNIPLLISSVAQICQEMWDKIKSIDWLQLGKDIISGIINGIKNMGGAIKDALFGVVEAGVNKVKGWLGIHSPSKMFTFFGEMIDQGLVKGLGNDSGDVQDAMYGINDILNPNNLGYQYAMQGVGRLGSNANYGMVQGNGYNQTVNVYAPQELSASEVARQTRNATRQMALELNLGGNI